MARYDLSEADFDVAGARFAIAAARFNARHVDTLLDGALAAFARHGVDESRLIVTRVPGAFELPVACRALAARADVDAVVALGCVIRGETIHFELVAEGCAQGIGRVGLDSGKPVIFGVIAVDDEAQALARTGGEQGNKGEEAALAALEMVALLRALRSTA